MKKILICLCAAILLAVCVLPLCSCGEDDGIPDGMQLVRGSDELGYYFFAPEEWTVSNTGNIACAYTTNINTASVTFVEAELPEDDELPPEDEEELPEGGEGNGNNNNNDDDDDDEGNKKVDYSGLELELVTIPVAGDWWVSNR